MAKIIAVHSFRGGAGKSNLTANLAATLALQGHAVGIVDTDIQSPGIHVLFGLEGQQLNRTLNDFLWGQCKIEETAYTVTPPAVLAQQGRLHLVPSSIKACDIARVLREGYDAGLLTEGFQELIARLKLNFLLVDTHPGLNEETLLSMGTADVLVLLMRPDQQDFQGTAVTVEVARKLEVPRLLLVVNMAGAFLDFAQLKLRVENTYNATVAAVLPLNDEMLRLASSGVFCLRYPEHPYTRGVVSVAAHLT